MKGIGTQTARVTRGEDGKYRWTYEMSLFRNPTVFTLIWKIFFFIIMADFVLLVLIRFGSRDFWWDGFLTSARSFAIAILCMTALVALGYLLYAAIMGGKYIVEFEMDEAGVNHKQTERQAKKAQKISAAATAAGAASGSVGALGAGAAASRTEMYSEFCKVKTIKLCPNRHTIKLNGRLDHNQVFVAEEDFDFVRDYVVSRCPDAKVKP